MDFNQKRILITGINGFIGRHLSNYLREKLGCLYVYGISRTKTVIDPHVYNVDITEKNSLEEVLLQIKPQIIFHLAADISPSREIQDLNDMIENNIIGTSNILTIVQKNNIYLDSFINLGTCEEYGANKVMPFTETLLPSPVSMYSGTKAATTTICKMFYNLFQIPIVTVRPSLVYGPFQSERFFIIQSIKKLLMHEDFDMTEGRQTRDFIYIKDLVEALVEVSKCFALRGEVVNVSSGKDYMLIEIIQLIHKLTESRSRINIGSVPYRTGEIMSFQCSNTKLLKNTGWKPLYSIEEGLLETILSLRKEVR